MSREVFEAWAKSEGLITEHHGIMGINSVCAVAEKAWQAAQADAYERAAKLCDELYDSGGTAYGCADAIRALAKETT